MNEGEIIIQLAVVDKQLVGLTNQGRVLEGRLKCTTAYGGQRGIDTLNWIEIPSKSIPIPPAIPLETLRNEQA